MTKQIIFNFYKMLFDEDIANHVSNYNIYLVKIYKYLDAISLTMDNNEIYILKNLYNLYPNSKTIDELSKELNLSTNELNNIKSKIIRKLKHPTRTKYTYNILLNTKKEPITTNDLSKIFISDIDLSVRTFNILFRNNIFNLKELSEKDDKYLLDIKIGKKGLEEVKELINKYLFVC